MVYRRSRTLLGNHHDAEEAVQEVFVRALHKPQGFQQPQVSSWLYRIATNWCLNVIRNRSRRSELRQQHGDGPQPTGGPDARKMVLVRQVLAQVDEACAAAAIYVHVDGMTHDEACVLLDVSRRTVGNLVDRFNTAAAAILERTEAHDDRQ